MAEPERAGVGEEPHRRRRHRRAPTTCCCAARTSTCSTRSTKHPYFSALDPQFRYDFPDGGDSLAPQAFVTSIKAPVFIAGAWQDEQTGGHWADLLNRFSPDDARCAPSARTACTPSRSTRTVLAELIEFLDFYVAQKVADDPARRAAARAGDLGRDHRRRRAHAPARPLRPGDGLTHRAAPVRGRAAGAHPLGDRQRAGLVAGRAGAARRRRGTRRGRSPDAQPTAWYLQPDGAPRADAAGTARDAPARPLPAPTRRRARARATPGRATTSGRANPTYDWKPVVDGKSLSYITAPLDRRRSRWPAPAASTSGSRRPRPTPTCRSRSARCAPTAPSATCRTAGCA